MAFGKRGAQQPPLAQPAFAVAAPAAATLDDGPDVDRDMSSGDGFDINLSFMQPYGEGKSVVVLVLLWLFLGGAGAHRFYLGHNTMGTTIALASIFYILWLVMTVVVIGVSGGAKTDIGAQSMWGWWFTVFVILLLWYLIDGIYVICRTLSAKVGG